MGRVNGLCVRTPPADLAPCYAVRKLQQPNQRRVEVGRVARRVAKFTVYVVDGDGSRPRSMVPQLLVGQQCQHKDEADCIFRHKEGSNCGRRKDVDGVRRTPLQLGSLRLGRSDPRWQVLKEKNPIVKDSAGKILEYKITIKTNIILKDFLTNEEILNYNTSLSSSYKVKDKYSETKKIEVKTIENLVNKIYQDLIIKMSEIMLDQ